MNKKKGKLCVIGLDGVSYDQLEGRLDRMPNIRQMLAEGSSGTLYSTVLPSTSPAWTTFVTGQNPGRHGVFGPRDRGYRKARCTPTPSETVLYDLLDKPLFINLPAAYPRQPKHGGYIIHWITAPDKERAFPPVFHGWKEFQDYIFEPLEAPKAATPAKELSLWRAVEEKRFRFAQRAFAELDFDLFFILFSATDWAMHLISKLNDRLPWHLEEEMTRLYADIDSYIGWFREHFEDVLVMSDHGLGPKTRRVYINRLLETLGYLKVKGLQGGQRGKLMRQFIKVGEAVDRWHILFRLVYIPKIRKIVKRVDRRSRTCDIDYAQTQAFATDDLGSIYINDLRFDQATVSAREYKKVQQSLIRSLELFSSSGIGQGVFTEVLSREQAFGKNSSLRAPDIVVRFAPDVELSYLYEAGSRAIVPCTGFNHHHLGIWMCSGDNFAPARKFDAHIMDLAPTILSYFGKEVPPEMEGRVLTEILDRG